MASTTKVDQAARAKARARRIALDKDRAARDARIEEAAAAVFAARALRTDAERAITAADERVAHGLRRVLEEGLSWTQAVELCELTTGTAHTLLRRHRAQARAAERRSFADGGTSVRVQRAAVGRPEGGDPDGDQ